MRRQFLTLIGVASLFATITVANSQGRAHQKNLPENLPPIIKRAILESRELKFAGTRIVEFRARSGNRERYREIIWKNGLKVRIERSDNGVITFEDSKRRLTYYPTKNELEESRSTRDEVLERLVQTVRMAMARKAKIATEPGEIVAGQKTEKVTIQDEKGNPIQRIWIDTKTANILKREIYDPVGTLVGLVEYVSMNYSPRFRDGDFEPRRAGVKLVTIEESAKRAARAGGFLAVFLPETEGLILDGSRVVGMSPADSQALLLHYRSPKGLVTLVQANGELRREMLRQRDGAKYSVHVWEYRGKKFALMGPMTVDELKNLAQKAQER